MAADERPDAAEEAQAGQPSRPADDGLWAIGPKFAAALETVRGAC
jgi:hypothetical protein